MINIISELDLWIPSHGIRPNRNDILDPKTPFWISGFFTLR